VSDDPYRYPPELMNLLVDVRWPSLAEARTGHDVTSMAAGVWPFTCRYTDHD
jgi:hypothetical protein